MDELKELRKEIDRVDDRLLELLNRRAKLAIKIGRIKKKSLMNAYVPEREREILERLLKKNKGPFPENALKLIYREIFSVSRSLEEPLKIACLGPLATFTHLAAVKHFGTSAQYLPEESIKGVFEAVLRDWAHFGVVPVENSIEGVVSYTLDMFMDYDLYISGEIMLEITHNLLSLTGERSKIKRIYSHPQATAQCRRWLEKNMPGIEIIEATSTAKAAELASKDPEGAAIAGDIAAQYYNLEFVERHIEDFKDNFTRFLVISKTMVPRTGKDKTSIMLSLKDRPGALHDLLTPFKEAKINLTKIESRPSKTKAWQYIFFIDLEGHIEDQKVKRALEKVKEICIDFKFLGSYPRHD